MPAGTTDQTTSISISATGRKLGIINLDFVLSVLGGLQILAIILSLLVTILLGFTMSNRSASGNYGTIEGFTFYAIVFLVSFWCLLTTVCIYISSATSVVTAVLLPKTVFFFLYNGMAAAFFLICSVTCLGQASSLIFAWRDRDIKSIVVTSAVMGIAAGADYILITVAGIFAYRRST